jgi:hypothetical protein
LDYLLLSEFVISFLLFSKVPHGGEAMPEDLPVRKTGVVDPDDKTINLARILNSHVMNIFGNSKKHTPHLIINHLHRTRIDQNRKGCRSVR